MSYPLGTFIIVCITVLFCIVLSISEHSALGIRRYYKIIQELALPTLKPTILLKTSGFLTKVCRDYN